MQSLYQAEVAKVDINDALENAFQSEKFIDETKGFAKILAVGAWEKREESDDIIKKLSKGWSIDRIASVDRSILRLAIYELCYVKDTPPSVVVDEAVELAKKYSTEESSKFINGILGSFLKELKTI